MRPRINKGRLVTSTNNFRYILSKRLVIEVRYDSKFKILSEKTISVRETLQQ